MQLLVGNNPKQVHAKSQGAITLIIAAGANDIYYSNNRDFLTEKGIKVALNTQINLLWDDDLWIAALVEGSSVNVVKGGGSQDPTATPSGATQSGGSNSTTSTPSTSTSTPTSSGTTSSSGTTGGNGGFVQSWKLGG